MRGANEIDAVNMSLQDLEIYSKCLPHGVNGSNVLCQTERDISKIYVLSLLKQVPVNSPDLADGPLALVCCSTRALAQEVNQLIKDLTKYTSPRLKVGILIGSVPISVQKKLLKENRYHIVVGTPGRLLELTHERALKLDNIKHFVLDCADCLDWIDIRRDVQSIFVKTSKKKQVIAVVRKSQKAFDLCTKLMKSADKEPFTYSEALSVSKVEQEEEIDIISI